MGLNKQKDAITVKFTAKGKSRVMQQGLNNLFTKFSLGDSDVNYNVNEEYITDLSGDLSMSIYYNIGIKNNVILDGSGTIFKQIDKQNNIISDSTVSNKFIFNEDNKKIIIDRTKGENLGLLKILNLPITKDSDTNLKLYADRYAVYPIDSYGDIINALNLKISVGDIDFYTAYAENTIKPDSTMFDDSVIVSNVLLNSAMLFSDAVGRPDNNKELSWADGFGEDRPYASGKSFYKINEKDFTISDNVAGYILLDKGYVVILNQGIIDELEDSISVEGKYENYTVFNEVVCQINRGEFLKSTNPTYKIGEMVRVTEIGLYDATNTLIAIGKFNKELKLSGVKPYTFSVVLEI